MTLSIEPKNLRLFNYIVYDLSKSVDDSKKLFCCKIDILFQKYSYRIV